MFASLDQSRRISLACELLVFALAFAFAGCGGSAPKLTFSPAPGTPVASPQTQISIRGASASQLSNLNVVGSRTGRHLGRLEAHSDGRGASFLPDKRFDPGERVDVSVKPNGSKTIHFHFTIARPVALAVPAGTPGTPTQPGQVQSFHSLPQLHPPTVTVTTQIGGSAPGDIFLSPTNTLGQAGPLILDARGNPIWFHPLPGKAQAFGFQEQRYEGQPVLTWWQGIVSSRGYGVGDDVVFDRSYRQLATLRAANGYSADLHDFVLTPQGTALILAYDPVRADLSSVGGPRDGTVLDGVLQELDPRTGLVRFEWHSMGHVGLDESEVKPASDGVFDYFHINSVDVDSDGNLLVSSRNTWTIYKINRRTGQIMWRLGGKHSSFKMGTGTQFAYQHHARHQPASMITLFDNGAAPQVHPQSRGIELKLDMKRKRATLVGQWTHPTKLVAGSQGDVQTLAGGDRFIGWGAQPHLTEFNAQGRVLFDAALADSVSSYRAFRFPWSATPPGPPAIATTSEPGGRVIVYASWNGATGIARWRILAGASTHGMKLLAEVARTGFETSAVVPTRAPYLAAQALDSSGRALGSSMPVRPGSRAG